MTVFVIGGFRILGLYIHVSQYLTVHPFKRFKLWIKKQEHVKVRVTRLKKHQIDQSLKMEAPILYKDLYETFEVNLISKENDDKHEKIEVRVN